jgi:hypothetical protein
MRGNDLSVLFSIKYTTSLMYSVIGLPDNLC